MKLKEIAKIHWALIILSSPLMSYSDFVVEFIGYSFLGWWFIYPVYYFFGSPWWD